MNIFSATNNKSLEQSSIERSEFDQSFLHDELAVDQKKFYLFTLYQPADQTLKFGSFDSLLVKVQFTFPPEHLTSSLLNVNIEFLHVQKSTFRIADFLRRRKKSENITRFPLGFSRLSAEQPVFEVMVPAWYVWRHSSSNVTVEGNCVTYLTSSY